MRPRLSPEIEALDEAILSPEVARERLAMAVRELEGEEVENLVALITWLVAATRRPSTVPLPP